uniref:NADH-ubiquinone oxidoreductase chain 2 n=1 Tax=Abantennarius coccineus TaxID=2919613 RepID=D3KRC1_9TELE|nr:NADH dehydrogenase subunit 2 [Abantennarius coccineus]
MNPIVLILLLLTMGLGTTIALASSHWLVAWIGLEMNTLAFLPIMAHKSNPRTVEATTKYFLVQATAASMILFAATVNAWYTGSWEIQQVLHPFNSTLFTLALALKMGLAPLHLWMPEVLQGLNLTTGLILCTWQKIAPFCLMLQLHFFPPIVIALGLVSSLVGGWGGLNQTQLRKLFAYSSIAHLGWMMVIVQFSPLLSLLSLLLYLIMTAGVFLNLMLTTSTTISALASTSTKSLMASLVTPMVLLSLGGLPPLTGFMSKWLIIQELTKQDATLVAVLMIPPALLSLYFYLRITYIVTLTMTPNNLTGTTLWRFPQSKTSLLMAICIILGLMILPITPTLLALLF